MPEVVQAKKEVSLVLTKAEIKNDEKYRERVNRESREQYRSFLDSLNRSSDREIERALKRA